MKDRLGKYLQTGLGILIIGIVVYAGVVARHVCCSPLNASVPLSDSLSGPLVGSNRGVIAVPQSRCLQLRSNMRSAAHPADCTSGKACCRTDHRFGFVQAAHVNSSVVQGFFPVHNHPILFINPDRFQTAIKSIGAPAWLKPTPLYILSQSLLC